jgi:DNA-binding CsgD family transcriptional regulator
MRKDWGKSRQAATMRSLAVCVSCAVILATAWLVLRRGPVGVPVAALIPMMLVVASILLPRVLLVFVLAMSLVALVLMHEDTSGLAPMADPVIFGAICLIAAGVGLALRGFLIEPPHPGAAAPRIDQEVMANGHVKRHPYVPASTQAPESALDQQMARLSRRERDVARLVLEGRSTRQIGHALFISERTVETHLANIYNKIDVHSRSELVNRLLDRIQTAPLP